jgi:hypothetical protein
MLHEERFVDQAPASIYATCTRITQNLTPALSQRDPCISLWESFVRREARVRDAYELNGQVGCGEATLTPARSQREREGG